MEEEEEHKEKVEMITPTPMVLSVPDMASELGPFINSPEVCSAPFSKVYSITDWNALHHRYKPENIPYLNKALAAKE
jgi:hypothetical protein